MKHSSQCLQKCLVQNVFIFHTKITLEEQFDDTNWQSEAVTQCTDNAMTKRTRES